MNSNSILKADVIDIIFEHRNKSYGAYTLRKFYNNRLYKAIGLMILFVGITLLFSIFKKDKVDLLYTIPGDSGQFGNIEKPEKPKDPKQLQQPVKAQRKQAMQKAASHVAIVPNSQSDPISDIKPDIAAGNANRDGIKDLPPAVPGEQGGGGPGKVPEPPAVPAIPAIDKFTPSNTAEVMPAYPGGMEALRKFLQKNLNNPQDIDDGQAVSVKIRFIVGYDGVLKGFETVEDGGQAFNNEVIRVLKKMPQWTPGKTKGENVSVYYTIPVKFTPAE